MDEKPELSITSFSQMVGGSLIKEAVGAVVVEQILNEKSTLEDEQANIKRRIKILDLRYKAIEEGKFSMAPGSNGPAMIFYQDEELNTDVSHNLPKYR